ncbi:uncharacterized protein C5orf49 homolog [Anneissia japonica]|uniref:uncharacterized protein C5orf49 homolog n=1 Tax=Anneissia japonica TaxID=1529436 RepID=UPI001425BB69|nr:uncharacterized protein C5orf49 homolog [Anneissia japonica]
MDIDMDPGETGKTMSNYGKKIPTPEEVKLRWIEIVRNKPSSTYDRLFHAEEGFHSKIHRDDRQHTMNLNVYSEESSKQIPVLSSSAYGHGKPLEVPSRQHARIERVVKGFYRTRGTNLPEYGSDQ